MGTEPVKGTRANLRGVMSAATRGAAAAYKHVSRACCRWKSDVPKSAGSGTAGEQEPFEGATNTKWGSPAFRALNFELYTQATGRNKMAAYIGSSIFLGIMGYFTYMGWQADQAPTQKVQAPSDNGGT